MRHLAETLKLDAADVAQLVQNAPALTAVEAQNAITQSEKSSFATHIRSIGDIMSNATGVRICTDYLPTTSDCL